MMSQVTEDLEVLGVNGWILNRIPVTPRMTVTHIYNFNFDESIRE